MVLTKILHKYSGFFNISFSHSNSLLGNSLKYVSKSRYLVLVESLPRRWVRSRSKIKPRVQYHKWKNIVQKKNPRFSQTYLCFPAQFLITAPGRASVTRVEQVEEEEGHRKHILRSRLNRARRKPNRKEPQRPTCNLNTLSPCKDLLSSPSSTHVEFHCTSTFYEAWRGLEFVWSVGVCRMWQNATRNLNFIRVIDTACDRCIWPHKSKKYVSSKSFESLNLIVKYCPCCESEILLKKVRITWRATHEQDDKSCTEWEENRNYVGNKFEISRNIFV